MPNCIQFRYTKTVHSSSEITVVLGIHSLSPPNADSNSPDSLADQVTAQLRSAIVTGALSAGERISEPSVAEQLQVSRSPVREALHRLEEERLIIRQPNRRIAVWLPTERDVSEIFSLRVMLESLSAERVIDHFTDADFAQLDKMVDFHEELATRNDYLQLIQEDKAFHRFFILRADNARLTEWWDQIMGQMEVLAYRRLMYNPINAVPAYAPDHRNLIDAFRGRSLENVINFHRRVNALVESQTREAVRARQKIGDIRA